MYGGKRIAEGDSIFIFASENEGGPGLIARGIVTSARATPRKPGILRQTPLRQHHRQRASRSPGAAWGEAS